MTAELERLEKPGAAVRAALSSFKGPLAPPRAARRRADTVLTTEAPTFVLRPSFANIHSFEALSACAVLDVVMPPYDDDLGRPCRYFALHDNEDGYDDMLRVEAAPASFCVVGDTYRGPRLA